MTLRGALLLAPAAALLSLTPPSAAAPPKTHVVIIDKMKFGAVPANLKAGDAILWVNRDMFRHTATTRGPGFDLDLPAGAKGKTIVRMAGPFKIYCRYHPGMTGVLSVAKR